MMKNEKQRSLRHIVRNWFSPTIVQRFVALCTAVTFVINIAGVSAFAIDDRILEKKYNPVTDSKNANSAVLVESPKTPNAAMTPSEVKQTVTGDKGIFKGNEQIGVITENNEAVIFFKGEGGGSRPYDEKKDGPLFANGKPYEQDKKDSDKKDVVETSKQDLKNNSEYAEKPGVKQEAKSLAANVLTTFISFIKGLVGGKQDDKSQGSTAKKGEVTTNTGVQEVNKDQKTETQKATGKQLDDSTVSVVNLQNIQDKAQAVGVSTVAKDTQNSNMQEVLAQEGCNAVIAHCVNKSGDGRPDMFVTVYKEDGKVKVAYPDDGHLKSCTLEEFNSKGTFQFDGKILKSSANSGEENVSAVVKAGTVGSYSPELLQTAAASRPATDDTAAAEQAVDKVQQELTFAQSVLTDQRIAELMAIDNSKASAEEKAAQKAMKMASWGLSSEFFGLSTEQLQKISTINVDEVVNYLKGQGTGIINCAVNTLSQVFGLNMMGVDKAQIASDAILSDIINGNLDISAPGQIQLSMNAMQQAAAKNGLQLNGYQVGKNEDGTYDIDTLKDIAKTGVPVIAHLDLGDGRGHYVVVTADKDGNLTITDPSGKKMSETEFKKLWSGNILTQKDCKSMGKVNKNIVELGSSDLLGIKGAGFWGNLWNGVKSVAKSVGEFFYKPTSYETSVTHDNGDEVTVKASGWSILGGAFNRSTVTTTVSNKKTGKTETNTQKATTWFNTGQRKVSSGKSGEAIYGKVKVKVNTESTPSGVKTYTEITVPGKKDGEFTTAKKTELSPYVLTAPGTKVDIKPQVLESSVYSRTLDETASTGSQKAYNTTFSETKTDVNGNTTRTQEQSTSMVEGKKYDQPVSKNLTGSTVTTDKNGVVVEQKTYTDKWTNCAYNGDGYCTSGTQNKSTTYIKTAETNRDGISLEGKTVNEGGTIDSMTYKNGQPATVDYSSHFYTLTDNATGTKIQDWTSQGYHEDHTYSKDEAGRTQVTTNYSTTHLEDHLKGTVTEAKGTQVQTFDDQNRIVYNRVESYGTTSKQGSVTAEQQGGGASTIQNPVIDEVKTVTEDHYDYDSNGGYTHTYSNTSYNYITGKVTEKTGTETATVDKQTTTTANTGTETTYVLQMDAPDQKGEQVSRTEYKNTSKAVTQNDGSVIITTDNWAIEMPTKGESGSLEGGKITHVTGTKVRTTDSVTGVTEQKETGEITEYALSDSQKIAATSDKDALWKDVTSLDADYVGATTLQRQFEDGYKVQQFSPRDPKNAQLLSGFDPATIAQADKGVVVDYTSSSIDIINTAKPDSVGKVTFTRNHTVGLIDPYGQVSELGAAARQNDGTAISASGLLAQNQTTTTEIYTIKNYDTVSKNLNPDTVKAILDRNGAYLGNAVQNQTVQEKMSNVTYDELHRRTGYDVTSKVTDNLTGQTGISTSKLTTNYTYVDAGNNRVVTVANDSVSTTTNGKTEVKQQKNVYSGYDFSNSYGRQEFDIDPLGRDREYVSNYISLQNRNWEILKAVVTVVAIVASIVLLPFGGWAILALALAAGIAMAAIEYAETGDVGKALKSGAFMAASMALPGVGKLLGAAGKVGLAINAASKLAKVAKIGIITFRTLAAASMAYSAYNKYKEGDTQGAVIDAILGVCLAAGGKGWSTNSAGNLVGLGTAANRFAAAALYVSPRISSQLGYKGTGIEAIDSTMDMARDLYVSMVFSQSVMSMGGRIIPSLRGGTSVAAAETEAAAAKTASALESEAAAIKPTLLQRGAGFVKMGTATGLTNVVFSPINQYVNEGKVEVSVQRALNDFGFGFIAGGIYGGARPTQATAWRESIARQFGREYTEGFSLRESVQQGLHLASFNVMGGGDLMTLLPSYDVAKGEFAWNPHILTAQERFNSGLSGFKMGGVMGRWFSLSMPAESFTGKISGKWSRAVADARWTEPLTRPFYGWLREGTAYQQQMALAATENIKMMATMGTYSVAGTVSGMTGRWIGDKIDRATGREDHYWAQTMGKSFESLSFFFVPSRTTSDFEAVEGEIRKAQITGDEGSFVRKVNEAYKTGVFVVEEAGGYQRKVLVTNESAGSHITREQLVQSYLSVDVVKDTLSKGLLASPETAEGKATLETTLADAITVDSRLTANYGETLKRLGFSEESIRSIGDNLGDRAQLQTILGTEFSFLKTELSPEMRSYLTEHLKNTVFRTLDLDKLADDKQAYDDFMTRGQYKVDGTTLYVPREVVETVGTALQSDKATSVYNALTDRFFDKSSSGITRLEEIRKLLDAITTAEQNGARQIEGVDLKNVRLASLKNCAEIEFARTLLDAKNVEITYGTSSSNAEALTKLSEKVQGLLDREDGFQKSVESGEVMPRKGDQAVADYLRKYGLLASEQGLGSIEIKSGDRTMKYDVDILFAAHLKLYDTMRQIQENGSGGENIKTQAEALYQAGLWTAVGKLARVNGLLTEVQYKAFSTTYNELMKPLAEKMADGKAITEKDMAGLSNVLQQIKVLGTGEGKTILISGLTPALKLINDNLPGENGATGRRTILLADNDTNVRNLNNEMGDMYGSLLQKEIFSYKGGTKEISSDKVILTTYSDLAFQYGADKRAAPGDALFKGKMGVLLMDEADMALFLPQALISDWGGEEKNEIIQQFFKEINDISTENGIGSVVKEAEKAVLDGFKDYEKKEFGTSKIEQYSHLYELMEKYKSGSLSVAERQEFQKVTVDEMKDMYSRLDAQGKPKDAASAQAYEAFKQRIGSLIGQMEGTLKAGAELKTVTDQAVDILMKSYEVSLKERVKYLLETDQRTQNQELNTLLKDKAAELAKGKLSNYSDAFSKIVNEQDGTVHDGYSLELVVKNVMLSDLTWTKGIDYTIKDGKALLIQHGKAQALLPEVGLLQTIEAHEGLALTRVAPQDHSSTAVVQALKDAFGALGFTGTYSFSAQMAMGFVKNDITKPTEITFADGTNKTLMQKGKNWVEVECTRPSESVLGTYNETLMTLLSPDHALIMGVRNEAQIEMFKSYVELLKDMGIENIIGRGALSEEKFAFFDSSLTPDKGQELADNDAGTYRFFVGVYEQIGRGIDLKVEKNQSVNAIDAVAVDPQLSYKSAMEQFVGRVLGSRHTERISHATTEVDGRSVCDNIKVKFVTDVNTIETFGRKGDTAFQENGQWTGNSFASLFKDRVLKGGGYEAEVKEIAKSGANVDTSAGRRSVEMVGSIDSFTKALSNNIAASAANAKAIPLSQNDVTAASSWLKNPRFHTGFGLTDTGRAAAFTLLQMLGVNEDGSSVPAAQQKATAAALKKLYGLLTADSAGKGFSKDVLSAGDVSSLMDKLIAGKYIGLSAQSDMQASDIVALMTLANAGMLTCDSKEQLDALVAAYRTNGIAGISGKLVTTYTSELSGYLSACVKLRKNAEAVQSARQAMQRENTLANRIILKRAQSQYEGSRKDIEKKRDAALQSALRDYVNVANSATASGEQKTAALSRLQAQFTLLSAEQDSTAVLKAAGLSGMYKMEQVLSAILGFAVPGANFSAVKFADLREAVRTDDIATVVMRLTSGEQYDLASTMAGKTKDARDAALAAQVKMIESLHQQEIAKLTDDKTAQYVQQGMAREKAQAKAKADVAALVNKMAAGQLDYKTTVTLGMLFEAAGTVPGTAISGVAETKLRQLLTMVCASRTPQEIDAMMSKLRQLAAHNPAYIKTLPVSRFADSTFDVKQYVVDGSIDGIRGTKAVSAMTLSDVKKAQETLSASGDTVSLRDVIRGVFARAGIDADKAGAMADQAAAYANGQFSQANLSEIPVIWLPALQQLASREVAAEQQTATLAALEYIAVNGGPDSALEKLSAETDSQALSSAQRDAIWFTAQAINASPLSCSLYQLFTASGISAEKKATCAVLLAKSNAKALEGLTALVQHSNGRIDFSLLSAAAGAGGVNAPMAAYLSSGDETALFRGTAANLMMIMRYGDSFPVEEKQKYFAVLVAQGDIELDGSLADTLRNYGLTATGNVFALSKLTSGITEALSGTGKSAEAKYAAVLQLFQSSNDVAFKEKMADASIPLTERVAQWFQRYASAGDLLKMQMVMDLNMNDESTNAFTALAVQGASVVNCAVWAIADLMNIVTVKGVIQVVADLAEDSTLSMAKDGTVQLSMESIKALAAMDRLEAGVLQKGVSLNGLTLSDSVTASDEAAMLRLLGSSLQKGDAAILLVTLKTEETGKRQNTAHFVAIKSITDTAVTFASNGKTTTVTPEEFAVKYQWTGDMLAGKVLSERLVQNPTVRQLAGNALAQRLAAAPLNDKQMTEKTGDCAVVDVTSAQTHLSQEVLKTLSAEIYGITQPKEGEVQMALGAVVQICSNTKTLYGKLGLTIGEKPTAETVNKAYVVRCNEVVQLAQKGVLTGVEAEVQIEIYKTVRDIVVLMENGTVRPQDFDSFDNVKAGEWVDAISKVRGSVSLNAVVRYMKASDPAKADAIIAISDSEIADLQKAVVAEHGFWSSLKASLGGEATMGEKITDVLGKNFQPDIAQIKMRGKLMDPVASKSFTYSA